MLRVFLLGPFEVFRDGQQITRWGGRQTRDLVKILAVASPQPVSKDQLAEVLWNEPSFRADGNLKVLVSRARRAPGDFEHGIIVTTEAGYAFGSSCWIDATDMERLMTLGAAWERAGRHALAEASYKSALDLYRGPLLSEDLYADWATVRREYYRRLHVDILLALGGLLLRRGDRGALEVAERLLAEDPYSDTAIQAVMAARAGLGDVTSALGAYTCFLQTLHDELQTSPSAQTEAFQEAILAGTTSGGWPYSGPETKTADTSSLNLEDRSLIGRRHELCVLENALEAAVEGRPTLVMLSGVAGIGKSRLLQALEARARGRFHILAATGRESDRHLPFQVLAEAVQHLDISPDELRAAMAFYADALVDLAPELAMLDGQPPPSTMSLITRRRLFEGFLHLIRTLAAQRPVLIVLDDLQWADPSTIDALVFCLRRLQSACVLCAVAVRPGPPGPHYDILEDLSITHRIELGPLSPDEVRRLAGEVPPDIAKRIVNESEGIPFYVVELVRSLAESGDASAVPSEIRRTILERVKRMPQPERHLLDAAAVLGDGFTLEAATALTGLLPHEAVTAFENLEARQLIAGPSPPTMDYRFTHDLIRRSVYEAIGMARRRVLHGLAADLAIGANPAVRGSHALRAGRNEQASRLFQEAGDVALSRLATVEAEELYAAALAAAGEANLGKQTLFDLLDRQGRARSARGDYDAAAEAHRAALSLARDEAAIARQKLRLGWIAYYQHEPDRATALSKHAENCKDAPTRGEGLLLQAKVAHATGDVEEAATQVTMAAQLVAPEAMPEVRALEVTVANHLGRFAEAALRFRDAVDPLRSGGHLSPLASLMLHGGIAMAGKGDYIPAIAILQESDEFCRQAGAEGLQSRVPNTLGSIYRELGEHDRAVELHAESIELAARSHFAEALAHSLVGQAELALDVEDTATARGYLKQAHPIVHDPLVYYSWRPRMRWRLACGRLALMEQQLDEALHAAEQALVEAKNAGSPKYQILSLLSRGELLGQSDGGVDDRRAALALALRLDAAPLIWKTALSLSQVVRPDERERLQQLAAKTIEELAGPLPDDLRGSFLSRSLVSPRRVKIQL